MTRAGFITGMIAGTVVGVGVAMMVNPIDEKDRRRITRGASRMFTTIGAMADRIIDCSR